ncbi:M23 family peptidase [Rhodohalobacter sp. SW132]|uniref:M23 family metallopeptidase n=1 Tax=Rhodohalobacter sp. SW132 TaxID=2293433 RepID=UPI000E257629|nr:M23 family metallopeptidase [Rhodohalobacter sp. SW132]REL33023.1 M23 family peptidase [Rhodohalobacter sp. SW132]
MSTQDHYVYDEDQCRFVPVTYGKKERYLHTFSIWLISSVVFACVGLAALSKNIGTPAELALLAENRILVSQLETTKTSILTLEDKVQGIAEMDNEMYRSVLGMDPIPDEKRHPGTGGADIYSEFDLYSEDTSEILKWTASRLDNLERRINVQQMSFDEIREFYNNNQERLRHVPAIRPLDGILLSGFGMRIHPVFKYKRMHAGVDFRAEIGTDLFATGDGVVKYASRRGNFGNLLVIDHGFGIETKYAHLSGFADGIRVGSEVKRGDIVAYSGNTGLTNGPHLHYEVHVNGQPVDPLNYLFADVTPEEYLMYQEIARTNPTSMD